MFILHSVTQKYPCKVISSSPTSPTYDYQCYHQDHLTHMFHFINCSLYHSCVTVNFFRIGRPLWLLMVLIIVVAGIVSVSLLSFIYKSWSVIAPCHVSSCFLLQAMNLFFFYLVTWRHLVAGACLGFLGYTFGATAAILTRMSRPQVMMTIAMMILVIVFLGDCRSH